MDNRRQPSHAGQKRIATIWGELNQNEFLHPTLGTPSPVFPSRPIALEQALGLSQHNVITERFWHASHDGMNNVVSGIGYHHPPPTPKTLDEVSCEIVRMRSSKRNLGMQASGLNLRDINIHERQVGYGPNSLVCVQGAADRLHQRFRAGVGRNEGKGDISGE